MTTNKIIRAKQITWDILDSIGCVAIGVEVRESINEIVAGVCRSERIFLGEKIARKIYEKVQHRDFAANSFHCNFETMLRAFSENSQLKAISPPELVSAISITDKVLEELDPQLLLKIDRVQLGAQIEYAMRLCERSGVELEEAIADCLRAAGLLDKLQHKYFPLIYAFSHKVSLCGGSCDRNRTIELPPAPPAKMILIQEQ